MGPRQAGKLSLANRAIKFRDGISKGLCPARGLAVLPCREAVTLLEFLRTGEDLGTGLDFLVGEAGLDECPARAKSSSSPRKATTDRSAGFHAHWRQKNEKLRRFWPHLKFNQAEAHGEVNLSHLLRVKCFPSLDETVDIQKTKPDSLNSGRPRRRVGPDRIGRRVLMRVADARGRRRPSPAKAEPSEG